MKATIDKQEANKVTLLINVEEPELKKAQDQAYRKLVKQVNIPGFRKGHAPRHILEHYLGKGSLLQQALDELIPTLYEDAVRETGIKPIDQPSVDLVDYAEDKPITLKVEVEVEPEVTLHEYKGLAVERVIERVTDADVDHSLYHMRENQAELVAAEHTTVKHGDFVTIDFTGYIDGQPFQGGAAKDFELEIGSGTFIPGFEDQLIGANVGDSVEVNVTFPANYGRESLAGKDAMFTVQVHGIKERHFPDINDDFAKDVSDFDTLAELRADIKGNLEKQAADKADTEMQNKLVLLAAEKAEVEVPAVMVDREVEVMLNDFARSLAYQGYDVERYLQAIGRTVEDMKADFRDDAQSRVKSRLVLDAIAEREGITVSADEIDERIASIAQNAGQNADEVKARYNERRDILADNLRIEKTVAFLVSSAQVTEKVIDAPVEAGHEGHVLPNQESGDASQE